MSLFHSGKLRQLWAFQRPDWRGFIVPKQTLSLAALFTQLPPSSSLKALQENTEKNQNNNNKNPNKCCNTRHSHCLALFPVLPSTPCASVPPWAGSRAGPDLGDIQKLPADCCDPRPLATQDRTLASRKLLQMTTVASQKYKEYNRDSSVCRRPKGATKKARCKLPTTTTSFSVLLQVVVSPEAAIPAWWLLPLAMQLKPPEHLFLQDTSLDAFISYKYVNQAGLLSVSFSSTVRFHSC